MEGRHWQGDRRQRGRKVSTYLSFEFARVLESKKTSNIQTDSMTENEFRVTADTGDILLFRSTHRMASLQRGITASDFGTG
jgi:hypothetical protein